MIKHHKIIKSFFFDTNMKYIFVIGGEVVPILGNCFEL